jgi:hypothetical protein
VVGHKDLKDLKVIQVRKEIQVVLKDLKEI